MTTTENTAAVELTAEQPDDEFSRVVHWLARWGVGLVDSDCSPLSIEQIGRLARFYAEDER